MTVTGSGIHESSQSKPRYIPFGSPEFYVSKLEEALGTVEGQPLAFPELIGRLRTIWADDDRQLVLERLEQLHVPTERQGPVTRVMQHLEDERRRSLSTDEQEQLAQTLAELVREAGTLPARQRDRADRAVARLSRLLPVDQAWLIIEPWFGDRRAFRRSVVIRVLLEHGVPPELAPSVIDQYRATKDRGLLKLIGRNPHVAALFKESDVLEALTVPERDWQREPIQTPDGPVGPFIFRDTDTRYWKMRAIEVMLIGDHVPSDAVAFERPMEFVWAVGRQRHKASLPLLRRVLEQYKADPEFVWRCMRALDRMGEPSDIEHVRSLAVAIVESHDWSRAA